MTCMAMSGNGLKTVIQKILLVLLSIGFRGKKVIAVPEYCVAAHILEIPQTYKQQYESEILTLQRGKALVLELLEITKLQRIK